MRPGWDVPTRTRLDPTAGGETPPAGQDGAQGSGRGDHKTSEAATPPPHSGDVAGFIDSLVALSVHLKDREKLENEQRRSFNLRALGAVGLLGTQGVLDLFVLNWLSTSNFYYYTGPTPTTPIALIVAAAGTALLAFVWFWRLGASPLRIVADSADRVALRHEDSPLRDRIRISQWILFDTAFTRFAMSERAFKARQAGAVLAIAGWATVAVWGVTLVELTVHPTTSYPIGSGYPSPYDPYVAGAVAFFLLATLLTMVSAWRGTLAELDLAQHNARQVLAFDADFGGFLPRAEKERVTRIVELRGGGASEGEGD